MKFKSACSRDAYSVCIGGAVWKVGDRWYGIGGMCDDGDGYDVSETGCCACG